MTEARATPGRSTQEGPCGLADCAEPVRRRRIPSTTPEAAVQAAVDPSAEDDPYRVERVRITSDRRRREPEPVPVASAEEPTDSTVRVRGADPGKPATEPAPEPHPLPGAGDSAEPAPRGPRAGFRGRVGRGRLTEREPRRHFLTGIYPGR